MCVRARGEAQAPTYSCIKIHVAVRGQPAQVQTLALNAKQLTCEFHTALTSRMRTAEQNKTHACMISKQEFTHVTIFISCFVC